MSAALRIHFWPIPRSAMRLLHMLRPSWRLARGASAAALLSAAGCGDRAGHATAPELRVIDPPIWSAPLTRSAPIDATRTASVTVGVGGGRLALPDAGLEIVIPPGAVKRQTTISVTAPAGSGFVYTFAPHGLRFAAPLVVKQSLGGIDAGRIGATSLQAAYFDGPSAIDPATGDVLVSEILPVLVDPAMTTATFHVTHFSGYMVASGKK